MKIRPIYLFRVVPDAKDTKYTFLGGVKSILQIVIPLFSNDRVGRTGLKLDTAKNTISRKKIRQEI